MTGLRRVTDLATVQVAPNPGPMTLDGTNSYLLAAPGAAGSVVVDPGPDDDWHLLALAAAGPVELVLITHRHPDHTGGAAAFHALTGAPVRAVDPRYCHGGVPLLGGEQITAAGLLIDVVATPGHTADSVCFHLSGDAPSGSMLTGDTVLGRGSTVIAAGDGTLRDYLESLAVLASFGPCRVLPAHGPELPDLSAVCAQYLAHREERLDQVRAALAALGPDADVASVTDRVYRDVDPAIRFAAEHSVAAQLEYLRRSD